MNVAALYDVHAMPWALEAVLAAVDEERIDVVVFGGDYLYGPYPRETVAMIRALDAKAVRGNADDGAEQWESAQLGDDDREWLRALPLAIVVDDVLYCHASPSDNTPITTAITPDDAVLATFGDTTGTVVIGHTHHQFDKTIGDLRVVNAGSVGMAYESDVAAYWTIIDDGEPIFRRTRFDVDRAVRELHASAWPHAAEFVAENLLAAVDREEAIASLESRRT